MPTHVSYTSFKPVTSAWRGVAAVVVLHVLLFAALYSGLGAKIFKKEPVVVVAQLSAAPEPQPQQPFEPIKVQPSKPPVKEPTIVPAEQPVVQPTVQAAPAVPALLPAPVLVPALTDVSVEQKPLSPAVLSPASAPGLAVAVAPVRELAKLQASGNCKKPEYPAISRNKEEEGSVQLLFLIGAQGQVLDSKIEKSSGFARLDEAARTALAQCQFKPGSVDGKPEPSWAQVKYTWRLN